MLRPPTSGAGREGGFALISVLLVVALLGVIGAEFAYSMRLEASAVRAYKATIAGGHLAEAAVEQAIRELAAEAPFVAIEDDGLLTFYTRERLPIPRLPRSRVPLGSGEFSYRITDEESRINLNSAAQDRIDRLLQAFGLEKEERDVINDSIQDWRDPNEEHRLNGAESDDYYLSLPLPYRARNGNFESVRELLQVKGVTPALFNGSGDRPGLVDAVTVKSQGLVNLNTAGPFVLRALGLSAAEISQIVQGRGAGPFPNAAGQFASRGLGATSRTFRIEAEGFVDGRSSARLTVIVQRQGDATRPSIAVLESSGIQ